MSIEVDEPSAPEPPRTAEPPGPADAATQDTTYVFNPAEASLVVDYVDAAHHGAEDVIEASRRLQDALGDAVGKPPRKASVTTTSVVEPAHGGAHDGGHDPSHDGALPVPAPAEVEQEAEPDVTPGTDGSILIGAPITHELDRAFLYELTVDGGTKVTCSLGPYDPQPHDDAAFVWPPRIRHVGPAVVDLWDFMATQLTHPAAVARFRDLLFERRRDAYANGVAAIAAYQAAADATQSVGFDEALGLVRAWTLARRLKRADDEVSCRLALAAAVERLWTEPESRGGVALPMLAALARTNLAQADDPVPVDELLESAAGKYLDSDEITFIADIRRARTADRAVREALSEAEVEALAARARLSSGLRKQVLLRDAIGQAHRYGLTSTRRRLTSELEAMSFEDLGFHTFETTVSMSRVPIERYYRQFLRHVDWRPGLSLFAQTQPPTGTVRALRSEVAAQRNRPRLMNLAAPHVVDGDGLPSWAPDTEEAIDAYRMGRAAQIHARACGIHLAEILNRMHVRYGPIPVEDVAGHFAYDGRGNLELAEVFARALRHFWNQDYEACVHIAVPRIESAVRLILRELNVGTYQTQLGSSPGVYPPLGSLLALLDDEGFDEDWSYFFKWLLVSHSGLNLRNQIAHGRVRAANSSDAALVLRALALVVLLSGPGNADRFGPDTPGAQDPSEDPEACEGSSTTDAPGSGQPRGSRSDLRRSLQRPIERPLPEARPAASEVVSYVGGTAKSALAGVVQASFNRAVRLVRRGTTAGSQDS